MKLAQEEKEKLNELLDNGYEYLARDKNEFLCAYEFKPEKMLDFWANGGYWVTTIDNDEYYKFITWDDEEPVLIQNLLKESEVAE